MTKFAHSLRGLKTSVRLEIYLYVKYAIRSALLVGLDNRFPRTSKDWRYNHENPAQVGLRSSKPFYFSLYFEPDLRPL
jgi:hypothetical protein